MANPYGASDAAGFSFNLSLCLVDILKRSLSGNPDLKFIIENPQPQNNVCAHPRSLPPSISPSLPLILINLLNLLNTPL